MHIVNRNWDKKEVVWGRSFFYHITSLTQDDSEHAWCGEPYQFKILARTTAELVAENNRELERKGAVILSQSSAAIFSYWFFFSRAFRLQSHLYCVKSSTGVRLVDHWLDQSICSYFLGPKHFGCQDSVFYSLETNIPILVRALCMACGMLWIKFYFLSAF